MLIEKDPKAQSSRCHGAPITASLSDGVLVGTCSTCKEQVCRINPRNGLEEWLNGESPWTKKDAVKIGATGQFPEGKLVRNDEGELQFMVGSTQAGKVVINFGKAVSWLGMNPDHARGLSELLLKHAEQAEHYLAAIKKESKH